MSNPMTALGDVIYGGTGGAATVLPIGSGVLHGGATPSWSAVVESDLTLAANTTNDATTVRHGFLPRLTGSGAAYLRADGSWATPAGVASGYTTVSLNNDTTKTVTHGFGAYPIVQVINASGLLLSIGSGITSITHNSVNDFTAVLAAPTSGTVIVSIGSPQAASYLSVSNDYPLTNADRFVSVTAAGKTVTLVACSGATGLDFTVENSSTGNIYVLPKFGEPIEGQSSQTVPPNCAMSVKSSGAVWRIF
jgi:hypothetical protein